MLSVLDTEIVNCLAAAETFDIAAVVFSDCAFALDSHVPDAFSRSVPATPAARMFLPKLLSFPSKGALTCRPVHAHSTASHVTASKTTHCSHFITSLPLRCARAKTPLSHKS